MPLTKAENRHPIYEQLLQRYHAARALWQENASLRAVCADRGMSERQWADDYCNRTFGLLTWSDTGTGSAPTQQDYDAAFQEAR